MPVSPLMDHKIVEYVCSIKPQERAAIPKGIFREAIKGILPEKVRMRYDKMGFPVPFERWKWPMLKSLMRSLKKRNILSFNEEEHQTMDRKTWALFSIESWFNHFFGNPK
jgi:asparagine synthase (glutamine-hydrolysing)